jgi:hypothetical protein
MPIRNVAVAQGVLTVTGTSFVYTVPASNALILKFGAVVNNAAEAAAGQFGIYHNPGGPGIPLAVTSLQAYQAALWSGWTVLNAGDQLYVNSDHQPTPYWFAGAVLPYAVGYGVLAAEEFQPQSPTQPPTELDPAVPSPRPPPIYLPPNQDPPYVAVGEAPSRAKRRSAP